MGDIAYRHKRQSKEQLDARPAPEEAHVLRLKGASWRQRRGGDDERAYRHKREREEKDKEAAEPEPEQSFASLRPGDRAARLYLAYLHGEDIRPLKLTEEERKATAKQWKVRDG